MKEVPSFKAHGTMMKKVLIATFVPITVIQTVLMSRSWRFCISVAGNVILLLTLVALYLSSYSFNLHNTSTSSANLAPFHEYSNNSVVQCPCRIQEKLFINGSRQLAINANKLNSSVISKDTLFPCNNHLPRSYYGRRGNFWVLYNYIIPTRSFRCDESITYTTHGDWTFLDNLIPLLERWQGPLSIALYAPGTDYENTLKHILYLSNCLTSSLIKELVTFHLFFDQHHMPNKIEHSPSVVPVNCSELGNDVVFDKEATTYKKVNKLSYPVNVARNVAREMATTHYVFASDIELYPSPNLIPNFIEMVSKNDATLLSLNPKVFVLSIFELESYVQVLPVDKRDLVQMLQNKSAIPFHKNLCPYCHRIPKATEWILAPFNPQFSVFHVGKRYKPYNHWEPIFIGTKFDPLYDERLSWEGKMDKMTQGYVLCVLDYEFHILNNAFLVHKPGIKRLTNAHSNYTAMALQTKFINTIILPELQQLYGTREGCFL